MKKTIQVIGRGYENAIQEALNLFCVKHRFSINTERFADKDWQKLGRTIKGYPPKLIITDHDFGTTANKVELIY